MVEAAEHEDFHFLQTEDEIAAANAVVGASSAGAKSFTATSGPGFSLMQEAIGFGHATEAPCVFINVQRVGPSTGMPTQPHQGDIIQSAHGSHGDYYQLVFYPNSVEVKMGTLWPIGRLFGLAVVIIKWSCEGCSRTSWPKT